MNVILPEPVGYLQGYPVLELGVEAAVLVLKQRVQGAPRSQLHDQHLVDWTRTCSQQAHQARVVQAAQHCQLLEAKREATQ